MNSHSLLQSFVVCSAFMAIGPSLILVNQYILKALDFPYPMFLSGLGVLSSGLAAAVPVHLGYIQIQRSEAIEGTLWYRRVLPVGLAHAGTLCFGNMVYLYLDVGFIQMLKAFTPVFIMLTGYVASVDIPTPAVICSVVVISLGTAMTCTYTPSLNLLGIFIMMMSELTEGIRLVITQFFLQQLKYGVFESQYVLSPASAFWLFFASMIFELPTMLKNNAFGIILTHWHVFMMSALMGIGVNFATYFVIQVTSGLTVKVLGTLRNVLLVIGGVLLGGEVVGLEQGGGYLLSLLGFVGYNLAKMGYFERKEKGSIAGAAASFDKSNEHKSGYERVLSKV